MTPPIQLAVISANYYKVEIKPSINQGMNYVLVELGALPQDEDTRHFYFLICTKPNAICEGDDQDGMYKYYEGLSEFPIILTNASDKDLSGQGLLTPFGPSQYALQKMHFNNETLRVPVSGDFTLTLGTDNESPDERGIYTDAKGHRMTFCTQFYSWHDFENPPTNPEVDVHPTQLTGYVNGLCRFRGKMGYEIQGLEEEQLEDGRIRRTFKIQRKAGDGGSGNSIRPVTSLCAAKQKRAPIVEFCGSHSTPPTQRS